MMKLPKLVLPTRSVSCPGKGGWHRYHRVVSNKIYTGSLSISYPAPIATKGQCSGVRLHNPVSLNATPFKQMRRGSARESSIQRQLSPVFRVSWWLNSLSFFKMEEHLALRRAINFNKAKEEERQVRVKRIFLSK